MRLSIILNCLGIIVIFGCIVISMIDDNSMYAILLSIAFLIQILNLSDIFMKYGRGKNGYIYISKLNDTERSIKIVLDETPEELEDRSVVIFRVKTSNA